MNRTSFRQIHNSVMLFHSCKENFRSNTRTPETYHLKYGDRSLGDHMRWGPDLICSCFPISLWKLHTEFKGINQPKSYLSELPSSIRFWEWKQKKKRGKRSVGRMEELWASLSLLMWPKAQEFCWIFEKWLSNL